jgi:coenzyme F420-0:L-glutamate ligase/coenzyme F420-1:gamma-L-glutamate ligase
MTNNLHKFLRTRRSVRRFRPQSIPESVIREIIETATYAPSAHDKQPWRFVVISSAKTKSILSTAITDKFRLDLAKDNMAEENIRERVASTIRRTDEAKAIVIMCHDVTQVEPQPDELRQNLEMIMGVQSVATAGLQLLLAAHAEGLGGTWICWPLFAAEEICQALQLPANWKPQGMIFLGYPDENPSVSPRKPTSEIVRYL